MKVKTGAVVNGRTIEVELDLEDLPPRRREGSPADVFRRLTVLADQLVVLYLAEEGLISSERATTRAHALREVLERHGG